MESFREKINRYKTLIKRKKKVNCINKKKEKLLHFIKMAPNKLSMQILSRKTKRNNKIVLKD